MGVLPRNGFSIDVSFVAGAFMESGGGKPHTLGADSVARAPVLFSQQAGCCSLQTDCCSLKTYVAYDFHIQTVFGCRHHYLDPSKCND